MSLLSCETASDQLLSTFPLAIAKFQPLTQIGPARFTIIEQATPSHLKKLENKNEKKSLAQKTQSEVITTSSVIDINATAIVAIRSLC